MEQANPESEYLRGIRRGLEAAAQRHESMAAGAAETAKLLDFHGRNYYEEEAARHERYAKYFRGLDAEKIAKE